MCRELCTTAKLSILAILIAKNTLNLITTREILSLYSSAQVNENITAKEYYDVVLILCFKNYIQLRLTGKQFYSKNIGLERNNSYYLLANLLQFKCHSKK